MRSWRTFVTHGYRFPRYDEPGVVVRGGPEALTGRRPSSPRRRSSGSPCSGRGCRTAPRGSRPRSGWGAGEEVGGRDHEPGRAEPALHGPRLDERRLHGMSPSPSASPSTVTISCPSACAASTRHEHTSCRRAAPSTTRTPPARTRSSSRAAQPLAEREEEALAGPDVGLDVLPVGNEASTLMPRAPLDRAPASTPSAWRRYAAVPRTSSIGEHAATTASGRLRASAIGTRTIPARGPAEPNDARSSPRSRSAATASEQTAITIAFRGPTFMNVCDSPRAARRPRR